MTPQAAGHPPQGAAPLRPDAGLVSQVAVVVPAHNEEQYLVRALTGVRAAVESLQARKPGIPVLVMVVADDCSDSTASLARRFGARDTRFRVLEVGFRSVGRSRRAGVQELLAALTVPASEAWVASTDADSCVPRHWLVRQVELADAGADVVLGSVEPDARGLDPALLRRWHARHRLGENHGNVYGANLGVRASAYLAAGGFPRMDHGEDRGLVARLWESGAAVRSTDTNRVVTSGRLAARAPKGFASYLLALAAEPAAPGP